MASGSARLHALVVGGAHNRLVCRAYLGGAGRVVHATPEFSSVAALAETLRVTEADALQRATGALASAGLLPGAAFRGEN